ncbi:MAG: hypothetical protein L0J79_01940 [Propionibacterium sp.]|nr:hypothetical protein [Propionibacterium sp.]
MVHTRTKEDEMPTITKTHRMPSAEEVAANSSHGAEYVAEHGIEAYRRMYTRGWTTKASNEYLEEQGLFEDDAFQDGFSDFFAGREKWHLSRCRDHDKCLH